MRRRSLLPLFGIVIGQVGFIQCTLPPIDLENRPCDCIKGYVCDRINNVCLPQRPVEFTPSNLAADVPWFEIAAAEVTVPEDERWLFDTGTGEIRAFKEDTVRVVRPPGISAEASPIQFRIDKNTSGELAVFTVGSLWVKAQAELIGHGSRPLVILARQDVTIDGLISVGADVSRVGPGPGGFSGGGHLKPGGGPGGGAPGVNTGGGSGGGGASFSSLGGDGGDTGGGVGGPTGRPYGTDALIPLVGGSGGGGGGTHSGYFNGGRGGHGGGAIQITSALAIFVTATGIIDAHGGGGAGGMGKHGGFYGAGAGGGGGAGGAVLLEAPLVGITGFIAANGGGGGGGASHDEHGEPGQPGGVYADRAAGGANGGAGNNADEGGEKGGASHLVSTENNTGWSPGGGGGGGGRIRINTRHGTENYLGLSPSLASGGATIGTLAR